MRFSLFLPTIHEGRFIPIGTLTPEWVTEMAVAAESAGFDGLWVGEYIESQPDVRAMFERAPSYYAPIGLLGQLATVTEALTLTTGVVVLPYHDPVILAREFATLDHISRGRMRLGVGLGGAAERFKETRKVPPGAARGDMMDEACEAMRLLWTEDAPTFEGNYYAFSKLQTYPKPIQQPLPLLMAGTASAALDRIGRLADGWIETSLLPDAMRDSLNTIRAAAERARRGERVFEVARSFFCSIASSREEAERQRQDSVPGGKPAGKPNSDTSEYLLVGTPAEIVGRLERYAHSGVTEVNVAFFHATVEAAIQQIELFASAVIPAFRGASD